MTLGSVKAALDEGAAHAMRLLAPPSGPQYVNEVVDTAALEAKSPLYSEIAAYGRDPTLFRISMTYCLESRLIPVSHQLPADRQRAGLIYDVSVRNFVFSDRLASERVGTKTGWIRVRRCQLPSGDRQWRVGKRNNEPEQEPLSAVKLHKRMGLQAHAGRLPASSCRRVMWGARCRRADAAR